MGLMVSVNDCTFPFHFSVLSPFSNSVSLSAALACYTHCMYSRCSCSSSSLKPSITGRLFAQSWSVSSGSCLLCTCFLDAKRQGNCPPPLPQIISLPKNDRGMPVLTSAALICVSAERLQPFILL